MAYRKVTKLVTTKGDVALATLSERAWTEQLPDYTEAVSFVGENFFPGIGVVEDIFLEFLKGGSIKIHTEPNYFYPLEVLRVDFNGYSTEGIGFGYFTNYGSSSQIQIAVEIDDENELARIALVTRYSDGRIQVGKFVNDNMWYQLLYEYAKYVDPDNPFSPGGESETGGGDGNFDDSTDIIEIPESPVLSSSASGFATIFSPSVNELRNLAHVMWGSNFVAFFQNMIENINELFVSLAIVPFSVETAGAVDVTWLGIDTAVSLTRVAHQYMTFDMGSVRLDEYFGSCLDYSPYTSISIFLPFIGTKELNIDEFMNSSIGVTYKIDILSGACVAFVKSNETVLYQFTGNCLSAIPLSNQNMGEIFSSLVNLGLSGAGYSSASGAAAEAAEAAAADPNSASLASKSVAADAKMQIKKSNLASATANMVTGSKPHYEKSGSLSGSAALLGVKKPFLFINRPRQSIPSGYQRYSGFPSNITSRLGDLSGYTVVEDIRLNGLVGTSDEISEIYKLLKSGVII